MSAPDQTYFVHHDGQQVMRCRIRSDGDQVIVTFDDGCYDLVRTNPDPKSSVTIAVFRRRA